MRILVVDDEQPIVDAVAYNLKKEGFEAITATDAEQCLSLVASERPDLVILDVMLPSASGLEVCRAIRKTSKIPIVLLTARAGESDRVLGLELGADDYVTKPFSMRELMARVKSILRRVSAEMPESPLHVGRITIDPEKHEAKVDGVVVQLSRKEYQLLEFFARNAEKVFSRQALLDRVWGSEAFVEERTVDVHVRWIREKVEANPSSPQQLLTVRGVGYKLTRNLE